MTHFLTTATKCLKVTSVTVVLCNIPSCVRVRYCFSNSVCLSVCLSVCPSVCPMLVLCRNEWTHPHNFWRWENFANVAPASPKIFWTSYTRPHSIRNDNQILHGDQTRCEENYYIVDNECRQVSYLLTLSNRWIPEDRYKVLLKWLLCLINM